MFNFLEACVQNIETDVLAGFGYGMSAQNIEPQWLAGKIFRNKELRRDILDSSVNCTQHTAHSVIIEMQSCGTQGQMSHRAVEVYVDKERQNERGPDFSKSPHQDSFSV